MAKGLLFALVRRGSKLNYLDATGNKQSELEGKVPYEKAKSRLQVSAKNETRSNHTSEENDSQHTTASKERRITRKKLLDMTFQKLSKGCKINRHSPARSNNSMSTENGFGNGDMSSVHRSKPVLVPSVASGYFVNECNSASKETNSKDHDKSVPRIVLTAHDTANSSGCCSIENRPHVQYSRYGGSLPHLRVNEKPTRPSSRNCDSSLKMNDFSDRRSKTMKNGLEAEQSPGFRVEAMTISMSPSTGRKRLRSGNSLRSKSGQLMRPGSSIGCRQMVVTSDCKALSLLTKDRCVKRSCSWGRADEKVNDSIIARQNRKIDIFLPSM